MGSTYAFWEEFCVVEQRIGRPRAGCVIREWVCFREIAAYF